MNSIGNSIYDCVVIGAGPAGSSAAFHFHKNHPDGSILWLDKEFFPRDKICGDGWGGRSAGELKKLGIKLEQGFPVYSLRLYFPDLRDQILALPVPVNVCPRRIADDLLRNNAIAKSHQRITWRPGCKITSFKHSPDGTICLLGLENDHTFNVTARSVIDASGASSRLARILSPKKLVDDRVAVSGRAYYGGLRLPNASLYICYFPQAEGYFWIFPTDMDKGEANVGLGLRATEYKKAKKPLKYYWDQISQLYPDMHTILSGARQLSPFRGWILYSQRGEAVVQRRNLLLAGEAAGLVDPLGGAGIYYALRSGREAARVAADIVKSGDLLANNDDYGRWCAEKPIREFIKKDRALQNLSTLPPVKLKRRMKFLQSLSKVIFKCRHPLMPLP